MSNNHSNERNLGEENYRFDYHDLESNNEEIRRWAIMDISKRLRRKYEDLLIEKFSQEVSYQNRRHIIRALGNISSEKGINFILNMLHNEEGLILGDIAEALGKLRKKMATEFIDKSMKVLNDLKNSPIEWIANKARWALRQMQGNR